MRESALQKLLVEELRDLYNAEQQILKALPKMAKAVESEELRSAFEEHRQQTEGQVERLDRVFELIEIPARGKKCAGMQGLLDEGKELMEEEEGVALDAALIGAAQKVEHYEIAAYGTARRHAEQLDQPEVAELLGETLDEEKQTDQRLSQIAEEINPEAESEESEDGSTEKRPSRSSGRRGNGSTRRGGRRTVGSRRS